MNEIKTVSASPGRLGEIIDGVVSSYGNGLDRVRSVLAMRMNQYEDIELSESDMQRVAKSFLDIELGSSTNLVMICRKNKCLYRERCALYVADRCPEGRECLHENKVLTVSLDQYITSMEVDMDNFPEMVMVNQLVEYELIEYRCNAILSFDHTNLKMKSVIGIDPSGQPITKEDISHALQIKMQVFKNKKELLDSFTATRKEKYKKQAALKEAKEGHAKVISAMKNKLKELKDKNIDQDEVHDELNMLSSDSIPYI